MANVLELEDVSKRFRGVQALQDCSFYVDQEKITGLIGPNGAGKTTAFNVITGVNQVDGGRVLLRGEEITGSKPHEAARQGIARTFQHPRIFENLSVLENLMTGIYHAVSLGRRSPSASDREQARDVLDRIGLDESLDTSAEDLSFGQKRLVELARAVMMDHEILLLDEPTAGVNPKLIATFKDTLERLREEGKTVLVIEHDMEFVMDVSDEIIVLDAGRKLAAGMPEQIRENDEVLEAYLGE